MQLLHALDVPDLSILLVFARLVVEVALFCLHAQLALGDYQDWLQFATVRILIHVVGIKCIKFGFLFAGPLLLEGGGLGQPWLS